MYLTLPFICFYALGAAWGPYFSLVLKDLGYSHTVIGVLMGLFSLAGVAGPFIFGHFADKAGRYKPPMICCHILTLLTMPLLAVSPNLWVTVLILLFMSLGYNSILPLTEAVTTIAIGNGGNYGKIRTPGTVSFIVMALFLQLTPVLRPNNRYNIIIWSVLSAALSLVFFAKIPAAYTNISRFREERDKPGQAGKGILTPPLILGLVIIAFSRLAMSGAQSFFSIYVVERLQWDAIGLLNAIAAGSEIPFMLFSTALITRFGSVNCLIAGNLGMLARLLLLCFIPSPAGAVLAQLTHSLSYGLFHPAALAYISTCVPPNRRALGMSLYLAIGNTLPGLLGSVVGGLMLDAKGFRFLYGSFALFPVISLALCSLIRSQRKD